MKVNLAGYNVDTTVLKELEEQTGKRDDLTPEVLSAAYARISRDPRSITEIRKDARDEVGKARKSNSTIIFKMGHHSVAEHAVFNLDVIGLSRYSVEELEKFRLSSYTEKSQRYITLDKDYVVPTEVKKTKFENMFIEMINEQNRAYFTLFDKLKEHVFSKHADLAENPKNHNLLEGWAKEDARYITALATESQVGVTINARNLELALRRFASHPLSEVQELGKALYNQIVEVAPSIVIFHEANERDRNVYPKLRKAADNFIQAFSENMISNNEKDVQLVDFTKDADILIAAAMLHSSSGLTFEKCRSLAAELSTEEVKTLYKTTWEDMQLYDSQIREFEYVNLTYNIVLSSACFGQLKRHRMASITAQPYDPGLGNTIPKNIEEIGMQGLFQEIIEKTNEVYNAIHDEIPLVAPYILTNSHRKRVLMRVNARELYHISRLREDAHAQWDIQNISRAMTNNAKEVMPLICGLIGGKDRYNEMYKNVFGKLPKVTDVVLPDARRIKDND